MPDPLKGLRIVVTRSAEQAAEATKRLEALGASVITLPAIAIVPPADSEPLRRAAQAIDTFDWIIFTSSNAVKALARELATDPRTVRGRVACVGSATAQIADAAGFKTALTPERYTAESLLPCFPTEMQGHRILIPRSALARDVIPDELRRRGAHVTVVEAYQNVTPSETLRNAPAIFESAPDWVLFASASAVDHICAVIPVAKLSNSRLASIGPATSAAIRNHGLPVAVEAAPHTAEGLVEALQRFYAMMQEQ